MPPECVKAQGTHPQAHPHHCPINEEVGGWVGLRSASPLFALQTMGSTRSFSPGSCDPAVPPPPALKCASFTTGSPGKSRPVLFINF